MTFHAVSVAKQLLLELQAAIPTATFERRYAPRVDRQSLEDATICALYLDRKQSNAIMRGRFSSETLVFGIAVQRASKADPTAADGTDALPLGDEVVQLAEEIQQLFLPQGALFRKEIEQFTCNEEPILELPDPFVIAQYQIYAAIVGVTYKFTGE